MFLSRVPPALLEHESAKGRETSAGASDVVDQRALFAQLTDSTIEFCENDFWDMWVRIKKPDGSLAPLALPPDADYDMLQLALCEVVGVDPSEHAILGLTERGSGPVLSLEFLTSDMLWLLVPEQVYGVVLVPATSRSLVAHGLDGACAVPHPVESLLPAHFSLDELRREMFVPGSAAVAAFAAAAARNGSVSLALPTEAVAYIHAAIAAGDAFFDLERPAKGATSVEFDEAKFAGYASNRFREWMQVRNVFDSSAVNQAYGAFPSFSRALLRLWVVLEGIARDVVALLCLGIGMPPARLLDLCDRPGIPPVMAALFEGEEAVPAALLSRYDAEVAAGASAMELESSSSAWQRESGKNFPAPTSCGSSATTPARRLRTARSSSGRTRRRRMRISAWSPSRRYRRTRRSRSSRTSPRAFFASRRSSSPSRT
ncbi:uncharacterized protein AMSG_09580 [Thecamonas trahens ATCC 50062]|uniref:Uncharacterized protein n=1 Tax=Thecamonas trahens ATCC 50062 TaxID=461836 RepID=A0A0L0DPI5_THETB|nr:hypothetical protein AMSG_09580 [Thecamonas trahens ATCC 50062]KNC53936.1 hypothetical protein AMSG_09580 [Thecamonas trahens ATCC 50062]|eukprot:XP_013754139.1 hypothetical protein AMSG_09580 [Thecamonas trahens ATCC 50062]